MSVKKQFGVWMDNHQATVVSKDGAEQDLLTIIAQVKGGKEVTVKPGETFYEGPNDVHVVGRNASTTQPAKFLVVLVKKQGAPILTVE